MLALALRNWKPLAVLVFVLVMLAIAGVGFWRGLVAIERLQAQAATAARQERDTHWQAEIAKANAAVQLARAEQASAAARADTATREAETGFETRLKELEKANADLPGGDRCGVERDRVRLLDGAHP